jgi:hypothetical protein
MTSTSPAPASRSLSLCILVHHRHLLALLLLLPLRFVRTQMRSPTDVTLYNALSAALTAQLLTAINASFLSILEDPDFGFSDVTPRTMLTHLRNEYGTLTPEDLEKIRTALSDPWNLDDPIEDLWAKIANIQPSPLLETCLLLISPSSRSP